MAFGWFYFATFLAICITLGLDLLRHLGAGVRLVPTGKAPVHIATSIIRVKLLLDLIPANVVQPMAEQKTLPVLVFTVLCGLLLAGIDHKAKPIVGALEALMDATFRHTGWIIALSRIALIVVVNAFHDMGRTGVNVLGNTVAAKLVMRFAGTGVTDEVYAT